MANEFKIRNGLIVNATTAVSSILDEDNMFSDSATALATQQSIKAYVDSTGSKLYDLGIYGFTNSTSTSISFNDSTYTFTLTDTGSGWSYYRNGVKNTISGNKTIVLSGSPPTAGTYYIFIDDNIGTLSYSTTPWSASGTHVFVAMVLWNNSNTPKYHLADERHKSLWPRYVHRYMHLTRGTALVSGGLPGDYVLPAGSPSSDDDNTFSLTETQITDEDIDHVLAALTDPSGSGTDYTLFYRTASSTWTWTSSGVPFRFTTDGYIQWDSTGTMTQGSTGNYYNWYLLYTNISGAGRYVLVPGRSEFANATNAYAESWQTFDWSGFTIQECVLAYQLTFYANSAYTTKGKVKLARAPQRIISSFATLSSSATATDHNALAGLQGGIASEYYHLSSAQHTQATQTASGSQTGLLSSTDWTTFNSKESALTFSTGLTRATNTITSDISTGKSGGQSIYGGTAAGDDLTIYSTSNATKGNIFFGTSTYDEVNNRLGLGAASPSTRLHLLVGNNEGLRVESSNCGYLEVGQTSANRWRWTSNYSGSDRIELTLGTGGAAPSTSLITVDTVGKMGLGGAPQATLDVIATSAWIRAQGSTSPYISAQDTTNDCVAKIQALDTFAYLGTQSNHEVRFIVNNAAKAYLTTDGNLFVGTSSGINVSGTTLTYPLIVYGLDSTPQFSGVVSETSAGPGRFNGYRHNGTLASKSAVVTAQNLLGINGFGWDGGATPTYVNAAAITFMVDGTVAEDSVPGKIVFYTRDVGNTVSPYERMVIGQDGKVGIANASPSALLTLGTAGTTAGSLSLAGATSGTCTIQVAAAAGTTTFQLPSTNGTDGHFLKTNGSGITSWASALTSPAGATTQVQYNSSGVFGASANFTFSGATITIGGSAELAYSITECYGDNYAPSKILRRARGTRASATAANSGDILGVLNYQGYNGSGWANSVYLQAIADGNFTGSSQQAHLSIQTTVGTTTAERMRITSAGHFFIGTTTGIVWDGTTNTFPMIVSSSDSGTRQNGIVSEGSAIAGRFIGVRHNGTLGSKTVVASGDLLASFMGAGWDNASTPTYKVASQIRMEVDGSVSAGVVPGRIAFNTSTAGTLAERMRITSAGALLIGTTAGVSITGTTYAFPLIAASADSGSVLSGVSSEASATLSRFSGFRHNGSLASKSAVASGESLLAINSHGWDGGVTPTYINAAQILFAVDAAVAEDNVPGRIVFSTRNSTGTLAERMRLTGAGGLYIGGTALDANYLFQLPNSSSQKAKAYAWDTYACSEAWKTNIVCIPNPLNKINSLRGITFTYDYPEENHPMNGQDGIGITAEELESLGLPNLVTKENGTYTSVNISGIIPILVEAIKELKTRIEVLEQ
jgi:hypothetical protein